MDRKEFFDLLPKDIYTHQQLRKIQLAYWLSKDGHRTQMRDDGERYFEHPRRVALLCIKYGYTDWRTICAALLHDSVEDTFIPPAAIVDLFDAQVYSYVEALSKKLPVWDELTGQVVSYSKKNADDYFAGILELPPKARIIKPLDRLDNLDCIHWEPARRQRYIDETVARILPIANFLDQKVVAAINAKLDILRASLEAA